MNARRPIAKILQGAVLPIAILLLWHYFSAGSVVVPSIGSVVDVLIHPFREPPDLDCTCLAFGAAVSILRMLSGFLLAALTAIPVGLLIGRCRPAREMLAPTMAAAMAVSPIAWIPVTIIVFGLSSPATTLYGEAAWQHGLLDQLRFAIMAVIFMGAFFPVALNTAAGAAGVRTSHAEAARVLGASRSQVLSKIVLPSAAPSIVTGLRVGGGVAWRVIVAAEIFPGTRGGLGYMISTSHEVARYEYAFASIAVIAGIGLSLDGVLRLVAERVGRWQRSER